MIRVATISLLLLGASAASAAAQHTTAPAPARSALQLILPPPNTAARGTAISTLKSPVGRPGLVVPARTAKVTPARKAPRNPAPAAYVPKPAPVDTAAARTRELSRRLDVLAPGAKLGEPMNDPENPSWRRQVGGRATAESRAFSMPLDDSGRSGFVARAYHGDRSWYNTNSSTGATFGVRTRF